MRVLGANLEALLLHKGRSSSPKGRVDAKG